MTSLSIVLTVFVLQLHHVGPNQKRVPRWIRKIVIGVIARILCMRSHIESYYGYKPDEEPLHKRHHQRHHKFSKDDVNLTTFVDNRDNFKDSNCNGRLNVNINRGGGVGSSYGHEVGTCQSVSYEKISNHLKILVSGHGTDDDLQDIINEWRLVAHIMDRFLFWLFLIGAILSSVTILVLKPMMKPPIDGMP